MSFSYDIDGIRTSKTVNGVTTHYIYSGSLLVSEYTDTETIVYIYDAKGSPIGFRYRANTYADGVWDTYWYDKNPFGDIVSIYSSSGVKLVNYVYDAWGAATVTYSNGGASTTAVKNNLTYRGYYYDDDLGMYYLQSRYYDPVVCRFINADAYVSTGQGILGCNMFAYCGNNPVMRIDPDGETWENVIFDGEKDPLDDPENFAGGGGSGNGSSVSSNVGNSGVGSASGGNSSGSSSQAGNASNASPSGQSTNTFLPSQYYTTNKAPKYSTPGSSNTTIRYNDYTGKYEKSTTYYDYAGRQSIRIDWTNHGYSNHDNPHIHFTFYSNIYPNGFSMRLK